MDAYDIQDPWSRLDAAFGGKPKRRKKQQLSAAEEESLAKQLAGSALSGIGYAASTLDKPGRAVRGTLNALAGGKSGGGLLNLVPFSDTLGLTNPDEGVTGRDLLRTAGMIGPEDTKANFVGGMAAEIATDPLTFLGGGLTKAGLVAKNAGLLDDAVRAAGRLGTGPRTFKLSNSLKSVGDLADPVVAQKLKNAAEGLGTTVDALQGQKLGTSLGFRAPWMKHAVNPLGELPGTGLLASGMDNLGRVVRQSSVGRVAHAAFNPAMLDTVGKDLQPYAEDLFHKQGKIRAQSVMDTGKRNRLYKDALQSSGLDDRTAERQLRAAMETGSPVHPAFQPVLDEMKSRVTGVGERGVHTGTLQAPIQDAAVDYAPRQFTMGNEAGYTARGRRAFDTRQVGNTAREEYLKHIAGGTNKIRDIYSDPRIAQIIDSGGGQKAVHRYIREFYGKDFLPSLIDDSTRTARMNELARKTHSLLRDNQFIQAQRYGDTGLNAHLASVYGDNPALKFAMDPEIANRAAMGGKDALKDISRMIDSKYGNDIVKQMGVDAIEPRIQQMAKSVANSTSSQRAVGGFGGHIVADVHHGLHSSDMADAAAETIGDVFKHLGGEGVIGPSAHETLKSIGLNADAAKWAGMENVRIPKDVADELHRVIKRWQSPDSVDAVGRGYDSFLGMFKSGVLTHPARYLRDLFSGMAHNIITGNFSFGTAKDASTIYSGGIVKGAAKKYAHLGAASDEEATAILKDILHAHGIGSRTTPYTGAGGAPQTIDDILGGTVGNHAHAPVLGSTALGGAVDAWKKGTYNPMDIRGVHWQGGKDPRKWLAGGDLRQETTFKPVSAGDQFGHATDYYNRAVPFLYNLKKGVDPSQAKAIVDALQVNYSPSAYTSTEKQVMSRLFPFYKFTSRMAHSVAKELIEHPGGQLGQAIRFQHRLSDPSAVTPEHIRGSLSIPAGELPGGDKRFITGFGLMHEQPLAFLGDGLKGAGLEALGSLNPLIKGPLEHITGKSFFQKGPEGGRPIEDLDPALARTVSNIKELATGERVDPRSLGIPQGLEQIVANSPASRLVSTIRTATDKRKYQKSITGIPGDAAAFNLLSGIRVTDVSPQAQDKALEELVHKRQKELGGRTFARTYFPTDALDAMAPTNKAEALKLNALNSSLERRSKERKKKKKKATLPSAM